MKMKRKRRFVAEDRGGEFQQIGLARVYNKSGQEKTLLVYQNHRGLTLVGVSISQPFKGKEEILSFLRRQGEKGELTLGGETTNF